MSRLESKARAAWEAAAIGYREHCERADTWNKLVEIPAMLELLGDVRGKRVVDVGCGQGHYLVELTQRGATAVGIEPSPSMLGYARANLAAAGLEAQLLEGGGERLSELDRGSVDIVLFAMMLEYVDDLAGLFRLAHAALADDGFAAASIVHPVRMGSRREDLPDIAKAVVVDRYLTAVEDSFAWLHDADGRPVEFTSHHRTVEQYMEAFREAGFLLERLLEPAPVAHAAAVSPHIAQDGLRCPQFMLFRAVKRGALG